MPTPKQKHPNEFYKQFKRDKLINEEYGPNFDTLPLEEQEDSIALDYLANLLVKIFLSQKQEERDRKKYSEENSI